MGQFFAQCRGIVYNNNNRDDVGAEHDRAVLEMPKKQVPIHVNKNVISFFFWGGEGNSIFRLFRSFASFQSVFILKNGQRPLFHLFSVISNNCVTTNKCETRCSMRCRYSNSQPPNHQSLPLTTRPVLPSTIHLLYSIVGG